MKTTFNVYVSQRSQIQFEDHAESCEPVPMIYFSKFGGVPASHLAGVYKPFR